LAAAGGSSPGNPPGRLSMTHPSREAHPAATGGDRS